MEDTRGRDREDELINVEDELESDGVEQQLGDGDGDLYFPELGITITKRGVWTVINGQEWHGTTPTTCGTRYSLVWYRMAPQLSMYTLKVGDVEFELDSDDVCNVWLVQQRPAAENASKVLDEPVLETAAVAATAQATEDGCDSTSEVACLHTT